MRGNEDTGEKGVTKTTSSKAEQEAWKENRQTKQQQTNTTTMK